VSLAFSEFLEPTTLSISVPMAMFVTRSRITSMWSQAVRGRRRQFGRAREFGQADAFAVLGENV
jgi:hypothetical protein